MWTALWIPACAGMTEYPTLLTTVSNLWVACRGVSCRPFFHRGITADSKTGLPAVCVLFNSIRTSSFRHSRAGGNPVGVDSALDSRLRGNDRVSHPTP